MSNADPEEVSVTVERDGVSVEKSFEPDDFPVPAIAFVIRSRRDEPVEITLSDRVPDDIEAEDIGFHPQYGADFWHNEEGRLVFEREFEAGEEYTTVYGIRSLEEDVDRFLGDPELERVYPEEGGDEDAGQVVSDVMNEGGTLELNDPGAESEASDDDLEAAIAAADTGAGDLEAAVTAAENATENATETETEPEPRAAEPRPVEVSIDDADVVSAFVSELRAGNVAEDDVRALREALGVDDAGSVDARIAHLQNELADLKAYTNALEEFLDENGDAQRLIEDLQGSISDIEATMSVVESEAQEASLTATEANQAVDEIEQEFREVRSEVQSLDDRFGNLNDTVTEVKNSAQSNSSELNSVRDRVDGVERKVDGMRDGLEDVEAEMDAVRDEIPSGELDGLDDRVGEMEARISDIESEIEGLAQMREQMANVFGGAAAQQVDDE